MSEPMKLTPKERRRIERGIAALRRRDPRALKRFEDAGKKHEPALRKLQKAIEDSEIITGSDLAIVINAR